MERQELAQEDTTSAGFEGQLVVLLGGSLQSN